MSNEIMDFVSEVDNTYDSLTLLDSQYDLSILRNNISERRKSADRIIAKFADVIYAKNLGKEVKESIKPKVRYVVEDSEKIYEQVKSGAIRLDTNKDGKTFAQLKNGNRFGKKLGINEEIEFKDIDIAQLSNALQMKAIENQLEKVMDVLEDIGTDVIQIIEGQQNDRIGLYYSGMNLYLESKNIQDETLRKFISANAVKSLSDANAQMVQSIQSDISYLINHEYEKNKGNRFEKITEKTTNINKSFEVIYRSFVLKATIYYKHNELQAMLTAIDEYGKFLKNVIIPNAPKLTEHDINDLYLQDGIWERRANSILEIERLKKELSAPKVYYIEMENSENE